MKKTCWTCEYGARNDIYDVICVNDKSAFTSEFRRKRDKCESWEPARGCGSCPAAEMCGGHGDLDCESQSPFGS